MAIKFYILYSSLNFVLNHRDFQIRRPDHRRTAKCTASPRTDGQFGDQTRSAAKNFREKVFDVLLGNFFPLIWSDRKFRHPSLIWPANSRSKFLAAGLIAKVAVRLYNPWFTSGMLGGGQLWPAGLRPDLNGQFKRPHFRPSVNWPTVCGPFLKRPTFPGPAKIKTDRVVASQLKDQIFILADSWPATLRFSKIWPAISRSVSQLAGHFTVVFFRPKVQRPPHGLLKFGRPFHGRSVSWPRLGRSVTVIGR
ncbi:hypothetical protein BpHYR1_017969 [Brachionus plicatilis]|uniref:Uncharacterized protein n=1 Tax=Brachionus plicatilis TaxID=10195 RepID=A0A3M7R7D6_BRAPC|nr:hypothetical protein BpHYR1_017969 [Brachionus plicatilis]